MNKSSRSNRIGVIEKKPTRCSKKRFAKQHRGEDEIRNHLHSGGHSVYLAQAWRRKHENGERDR